MQCHQSHPYLLLSRRIQRRSIQQLFHQTITSYVQYRSNLKTRLILFEFLAPEPPKNPCYPDPCGANAQCNEGVCTCLPEYKGDPYTGCRPECVLNSDCPRDKACIRNKCVDPCPGTCGQNAECTVINHIPTCSCLPSYTGNSFVVCSPIPPSKKFKTFTEFTQLHSKF